MSIVTFRRTPERMNHRLFVIPLLLLVPFSFLDRASEASAEPVPCTTYSIVGTVNDAREATAYLHFDDEPLAGHQVFAVFAGADVELPPSVLVTGPDGTATVSLPEGADAVSFSAESPLGGACVVGESSSIVPDVVPDVIVVSDTVGWPDVDLSAPFSSDPPAPLGAGFAPDGELPVTGPISPALPFAGVLVLATGWFARRLRGSGRSRGGVAPCRFPGIPL